MIHADARIGVIRRHKFNLTLLGRGPIHYVDGRMELQNRMNDPRVGKVQTFWIGMNDFFRYRTLVNAVPKSKFGIEKQVNRSSERVTQTASERRDPDRALARSVRTIPPLTHN